MGCNCKVSNSNSKGQGQDNSKREPAFQNFVKYSAKIIGFLIGMVLMPIIVVAIIWFMFDIMVLNKEVDLRKVLMKIIKINKAIMTEDVEEDEDYENEGDFLLEEYITENVEVIK